MRGVGDKAKVLYLILFIIFISGFGVFWMDYIGLLNINEYIQEYKSEPESVIHATDDEPSLIEREEFGKEVQRLEERKEELDRREALIIEKEKQLVSKEEKIAEIRKGLTLAKKTLDNQKDQWKGYRKNVKKLANKMANMPPEKSVGIMLGWEDTLIIDVINQMDNDATESGKASITSYLITLMPKQKASRITYLMTQGL